MGKKKVHHDEHVDETWLIPYADMLTLLLALFIVMFAMSKVDNEKLQKIGKEFSVVFQGGTGVLKQDGKQINLVQDSSSGKKNSQIEDDRMNYIKKTLEKEIKNKGYSDKVKVALNKEGLEIAMQDVVLFNSGDATVLERVSPLLLQISKMLSSLDNNIKIKGYTDNQPIKNKKFRSNWDLSAIRAINVMNFMVDVGRMHPEKLSIEAYGEYMPKFDNSTDIGRAKNRRVEISIVRKYAVDGKQDKQLKKKTSN